MDTSETEKRQIFFGEVADDVDRMLCGMVNFNDKFIDVDSSCVKVRFEEHCNAFTKKYNVYLQTKEKADKQKGKYDGKLSPDPINPRNWKVCGVLTCHYTALAVIYYVINQGIVESVEGEGWSKERTLKDVATKSGDVPFVLLSVMWPLIKNFQCGYNKRTIETALRHVKKDLLDNCRLEQPEEKAKEPKTDNKVPWNEKDDNFYENKEAVKEAQKAGCDECIGKLKNFDYDKLRKLLRKTGCKIRYMSRKSPPRGRVHKKDWRAYIKSQIEQLKAIENAFERGIGSRKKYL